MEQILFSDIKMGDEICLDRELVVYKIIDIIRDGKEIAYVKVRNMDTGHDRYVDNIPINHIFKKEENLN